MGVGENVGVESQAHTGSWYVQFVFQDNIETAVLSQARVYSASRLYSRLRQIPDSDLNKARQAFLLLYSK